jgi:hypothetical protein
MEANACAGVILQCVRETEPPVRDRFITPHLGQWMAAPPPAAGGGGGELVK